MSHTYGWHLNKHPHNPAIVELSEQDDYGTGFATVWNYDTEPNVAKLMLAAPELLELLRSFALCRNEWMDEISNGSVVWDELKSLMNRLEVKIK
jgi:hypothetical protein